MANSADPNETARYEPSHLDQHCLHRYLVWSADLERLIRNTDTYSYQTGDTEESIIRIFRKL